MSYRSRLICTNFAVLFGALCAFSLSRWDDIPQPPLDNQEKKLVAIADKMILAANRLSSIQDNDGLAIIDEFVPLAEHVVKTLGSKP